MPTRLIRDGILTSERVAMLGWAEEVFYRRLMSVVDDYGRFYAHPALLRAACYPLKLEKVSDSDIEKWLHACVGAALVRVYPASDGKRYCVIQDFGQRIQGKSKFPEFNGESPDSTVNHGDSRFPTVNPRLVVVVVEDEDEDEKKDIGASTGVDPPGDLNEKPPLVRSDPIPYQAIVDAYNRTMTRLPKVRELTDKRRRMIRTAWQADLKRRTLGYWNAHFEECEDDPFLSGVGPYGKGHDNWRPSFDYLLKPDVLTRVFESAMDRMERAT